MLLTTDSSCLRITTQEGRVLEISRPDGELSEAKTLVPAGGKGRYIVAVLGILQLRLAKYLVVVTETKAVGSLLDNQIVQATGFDLVSLQGAWRVKNETETAYYNLAKAQLHSGKLFFSSTLDLTNSFQRLNAGGNVPLDDRFFWNAYIAADFVRAGFGAFVQPVLYGVVSLHDTVLCGKPCQFGLISRRSRFRAGTRYFRRGVDADGHVANYNETEQILVIEGRLLSYVQTRGSVPAHWGEVNNLKYKPVLRIGESVLDNAIKHFDQETKIYGKNYLVNLVNQKGYEKPVKDAYESVVQNISSHGKLGADIDYTYFDFHHECSKMRWDRVSLLIDHLVQVGLDKQGWFETATDSKDIYNRQTSVVRTNCMDCLDRTNVVQGQIGRWVLHQQLQHLGLLPAGANWDPAFEFIFRNTWADNADGVSVPYSGTGALKTDFTRTGTRTKLGALADLRNSIVRYIRNNFFDGARQDSFDLLLGNHLPYEALESPFVDTRPLLYQVMPYVFGGSLLMMAAAYFFPRTDSPAFVNPLVLLISFAMFVYSLSVFNTNGIQFVNWPKLCPVDFVSDISVVTPSAGRIKKMQSVVTSDKRNV